MFFVVFFFKLILTYCWCHNICSFTSRHENLNTYFFLDQSFLEYYLSVIFMTFVFLLTCLMTKKLYIVHNMILHCFAFFLHHTITFIRVIQLQNTRGRNLMFISIKRSLLITDIFSVAWASQPSLPGYYFFKTCIQWTQSGCCLICIPIDIQGCLIQICTTIKMQKKITF